ncbi:polymeric immunoglobulin receptor-like [Melanotaenia boesemani]|uniref:polymeric immunoglobulin receptor-like n=1 Tax=Melanotaenia boesemani TaxID=1250792 RepID=UPI001C03DFA5|nr:polymeric immunoglobulin receptor-like [Melanotaenia boesemani]
MMLQNLLITLCIALSCVSSAAEVILVSGYEGRNVTVSCPYDQGYESHDKYLCKNDCGNADVLIMTTEAQKGRYSIRDNEEKQIFTVTISNLRTIDAGKYWCGVSKTGYDIFTEVLLQVEQEWCCVKKNTLVGTVGHPLTLPCPYPPQHWDNRKFLCKGDHRNNCTDMVTSGSRFTLKDDAPSSSFLVTITELEAGDTGTYWCGSDSEWSVGNYTKIQLSVDTLPIGIVVYTVPALLILLSIALIVVFKCKLKGPEASPDREIRKFEALETKCENPEDASHPYQQSTSSSVAQTQENMYQTITASEDIYSICQ